MTKIPIIVIVGPTASGKTSLAVDVAKKYNGEVISADSMQIYKSMDIGTAKPTILEMDGIVHHLIDFQDPQQSFSVADYVELAHKTIEQSHENKKLPIIAGGTGLYISSLLNNIQFDKTESDETIRQSLYEYAKQKGSDELFNMLKEIDPQSAETIHPNNIPRVVRAIEIYKLTGTTMYEHQQKSRLVPSRYNALKIGINYADRKKLYERIDKRVDIMINNGLIEEARDILSGDFASTAMQAIGYKELKAYIDGSISLENAVDNLKRESRRYAKRQLTWFRRDEQVNWFYADEYQNIQIMQKKIYNCIDKFFNMCYD